MEIYCIWRVQMQKPLSIGIAGIGLWGVGGTALEEAWFLQPSHISTTDIAEVILTVYFFFFFFFFCNYNIIVLCLLCCVCQISAVLWKRISLLGDNKVNEVLSGIVFQHEHSSQAPMFMFSYFTLWKWKLTFIKISLFIAIKVKLLNLHIGAWSKKKSF